MLRRVPPAVVAAALLLAGCSKNHDPVTSFHQGIDPPTSVQAAWTGRGEVRVTWELTGNNDQVSGFIVALNHGGDFVYQRAVHGAEVRSFTSSGLNTDNIAASQEETAIWLLVRVRAYDENLFQGPTSEPDSLQVGS